MKLRWFLAVLMLLVALLVAWLLSRVEWSYINVPLGPQGPARDNPLYATHRLATELGAHVVTPIEGLKHMPPTGSVLYLSSNEWSLLPGRINQLRQWIQQGGHLLVSSQLITHSGFSPWIPVNRAQAVAEHDDSDEAEHDSLGNQMDSAYQVAHESRPRYPEKSNYQVCVVARHRLQTTHPMQWALMHNDQPVAMRVPLGKGSVTVHSLDGLFSNRRLQQGDHALLATILLQITPAQTIWFVVDEDREPFSRWLWRHAWVGITMGLLFISAALWRGAIRFGPGMPGAVPMRRSMREQLTGTAQFLQRHDPGTLHRAALRALFETAQTQLQHYARLTLSERVQALAERTKLPSQDLARAFIFNPTKSTAQLSATLQLLETARRRLRHPHNTTTDREGQHPHADPT